MNTEARPALPKTADPSYLEKKWSEILISATPKKGGKKKAMTMPPPNVTGTLHIGHALTYTLQDVWIKFWRMQGVEVLAQPGLDHAGIATQMMVEKDLATRGLNRQDLGRKKFLEEAMRFKEKSGQTIISQLKSLGVSANWDRLQFTLDPHIQKVVRDVFIRLHKDGLIYKGERLVYWDTVLGTALSNLEVQTKEHPGTLWTLKYSLANDPSQHIAVATTRPETVFGDVAIAAHPEDSRYQNLLGKVFTVPFSGQKIPLIADERVAKDKGTGVLKITPAHAMVDFEIGQTHDLPAPNILDERGRLNEKVPTPYQGLSVREARTKILKDLSEADLLLEENPTIQMLPMGDRSGSVLEPRLTAQWFLNTKPLAEQALKAVDEGEFSFLPSHYQSTYRHWLENIEPWCLSRQLWWGHGIPAFYGPDGHAFVASSQEEAEQTAQAHYGGPTKLTPDPDVLDTWFSSALWPFVTLGWPEKTPEFLDFYPTQTLITGFDIIFFWVARMVMMGKHLTGKAPFKEVYIHGLVRDQDRQKMSKTKGNVINPLDVIKVYGADPLRLSLAALSTPGGDVSFGESQVETYRNFLTKLWNASRFCLLNQMSWREKPVISPHTHALNQWLIGKTLDAVKAYIEAMKEGKFYEAAQISYHFVWRDFCDHYIEMSKVLLTSDNKQVVEEVRDVGGWCLGICLHMLYPFAPFVTSELWSHLAPSHPPLALGSWPDMPEQKDKAPCQEIEKILLWTQEIRRIRALFQIPFRTKLSLFLEKPVAYIETHKTFLCQFLGLEKIEHAQDLAAQQSIKSVVDGTGFSLPIGQVIDLRQSLTFLKKKQEKLFQEKDGILKKIQNPSFCKRAPKSLVQETKSRFSHIEEQEQAISSALKQLESF